MLQHTTYACKRLSKCYRQEKFSCHSYFECIYLFDSAAQQRTKCVENSAANCPRCHVALMLMSTSERIENSLHSDRSCGPRQRQPQRPRTRLTSSDASQLSHWCSPNPFLNERLARPFLSRQIGWLRRVAWTNGEGVELQTEWKWPRETEGDTERETEMEGGIALAHAAPTHLTSLCCHFFFFFFVFARMILRWITLWPTSKHPGSEKIK